MQPKPAFPFWTSKQTALYIELPSEGLAQFCVRVALRKGPTGPHPNPGRREARVRQVLFMISRWSGFKSTNSNP
jgi:hypothetical protein